MSLRFEVIIITIYNNRQDGLIKNNEISGNKENGIHCSGKRNFTRIELNSFIGYNKKAGNFDLIIFKGIKADQEAFITVIKNTICKNLA